MLVQRPINARALAVKTGHHRSLNGPFRTRGYRHPSADGGPPHVQNAAREADSEYQTLDLLLYKRWRQGLYRALGRGSPELGRLATLIRLRARAPS
jgi:hypothetical protein